MYENETFGNYSELHNEYPELAERLLEEVGEGEWMNDEIYYYPSVGDYAEYELTEGWYIDLNLDRFDFRGAPNPLDYIDLDEFGEALVNTGDESMVWCAWDIEYKPVRATSTGW